MRYTDQFKIPEINKRTPFSQVLPFDKVFDPSLVRGLAREQIEPEWQRNRTREFDSLNTGLGRSGAFRTGLANLERNNLANAYERLRKQQVQSFVDTIKNPITDWYNRQERSYYQNPTGFKMPELPTFDQFMQDNPGIAAQVTSQQQPQLNSNYTTMNDPMVTEANPNFNF